MKLEQNVYTLDSFFDYLAGHPDEILSENEGRWLKAYLLYVRRDWKPLFAQYGLQPWGSIWRFEIPRQGKEEEPVDYFAYEWREGLLLCFTGSTKDAYEETLERFIDDNLGVTQGWIPPPVFETLRNHILQKGGTMYRFISRRSRFSEVEAKIGRQEYNRRFSYSGEDAEQVSRETQAMYGTLPVSMDFRVGGNKIQLNKSGMFLVRDMNSDTLELLRTLVDMTAKEIIMVKQTTEKWRVSSREIGESGHQITVPTLTAGKITTPHGQFDIKKVKMLFGEGKNEPDVGKVDEESDEFPFSFIDTYVSDDATSFSATVVDDEKGTIFGISANNGELMIIPKYRTTFETFVRFYESIVEEFDASASLATLSEPPVAR